MVATGPISGGYLKTTGSILYRKGTTRKTIGDEQHRLRFEWKYPNLRMNNLT
jgi:hypothetical protein